MCVYVCVGDTNSAALVLGDIVCLTAGAAVPADLRLIQVNELECVQAPLTGEPEPVEKFEYVGCETEREEVQKGKQCMILVGCGVFVLSVLYLWG